MNRHLNFVALALVLIFQCTNLHAEFVLEQIQPEQNTNLVQPDPDPNGFQYKKIDEQTLVVFKQYESSSGEEYWITDGTDIGTRLLYETIPGTGPTVNRTKSVFTGDYLLVLDSSEFSFQLTSVEIATGESKVLLGLADLPFLCSNESRYFYLTEHKTFFRVRCNVYDSTLYEIIDGDITEVHDFDRLYQIRWSDTKVVNGEIHVVAQGIDGKFGIFRTSATDSYIKVAEVAMGGKLLDYHNGYVLSMTKEQLIYHTPVADTILTPLSIPGYVHSSEVFKAGDKTIIQMELVDGGYNTTRLWQTDGTPNGTFQILIEDTDLITFYVRLVSNGKLFIVGYNTDHVRVVKTYDIETKQFQTVHEYLARSFDYNIYGLNEKAIICDEGLHYYSEINSKFEPISDVDAEELECSKMDVNSHIDQFYYGRKDQSGITQLARLSADLSISTIETLPPYLETIYPYTSFQFNIRGTLGIEAMSSVWYDDGSGQIYTQQYMLNENGLEPYGGEIPTTYFNFTKAFEFKGKIYAKKYESLYESAIVFPIDFEKFTLTDISIIDYLGTDYRTSNHFYYYARESRDDGDLLWRSDGESHSPIQGTGDLNRVWKKFNDNLVAVNSQSTAVEFISDSGDLETLFEDSIEGYVVSLELCEVSGGLLVVNARYTKNDEWYNSIYRTWVLDGNNRIDLIEDQLACQNISGQDGELYFLGSEDSILYGRRLYHLLKTGEIELVETHISNFRDHLFQNDKLYITAAIKGNFGLWMVEVGREPTLLADFRESRLAGCNEWFIWYQSACHPNFQRREIGGKIINSQYAKLMPLGEHFYFFAESAEFGNEWWQSDGTILNTKVMSDLLPGTIGYEDFEVLHLSDSIYFIGITGNQRPHRNALYQIHENVPMREFELPSVSCRYGLSCSASLDALFSEQNISPSWYYSNNLPETYSLSSNGELTIEGSEPGISTFKFSITDGYSQSSVKMEINIIPNNRPTLIGVTEFLVSSGIPFEIDLSTLFSDLDSDALTFTPVRGFSYRVNLAESGVLSGEITSPMELRIGVSDGIDTFEQQIYLNFEAEQKSSGSSGGGASIELIFILFFTLVIFLISWTRQQSYPDTHVNES